jgi:DNA-binding transcriptional MerR regulator
MSPPPRTPPEVSIVARPARTEVRLSADELAAAAGIAHTTLVRLVRLGLLDPLDPGGREFEADAAARLRRMLRLRRDLGVNFTGAAVIVDLLERCERLESELARLRGGG